jgi:hypothetical protein
LQGVGLEEGFLDRVQLALGRQAFDCDYLLCPDRANSGEAAFDGDAIDQHRARGTLSFAAAEFRAGEIQVIAQNAEECAVRIRIDPPRPTVHMELGNFGHGFILPPEG